MKRKKLFPLKTKLYKNRFPGKNFPSNAARRRIKARCTNPLQYFPSVALFPPLLHSFPMILRVQFYSRVMSKGNFLKTSGLLLSADLHTVYGKPIGAKFRGTTPATNFFLEISIKLTKIKSRSTDFLSKSRHI